jgi:hypothetical protein
MIRWYLIYNFFLGNRRSLFLIRFRLEYTDDSSSSGSSSDSVSDSDDKVSWQWLSEQGWLDYDLPTIKIIETNYQNRTSV